MLVLSSTVQQPASKPSSGVDAMVETYVSFSTAAFYNAQQPCYGYDF